MEFAKFFPSLHKSKWTKKQHFLFTSNIEGKIVKIANNFIWINLTVTLQIERCEIRLN